MIKGTHKKGFTLYELIIVIIIIGVLASLAFPRLFGLIEFSRCIEALQSIAVIRNSLERCYYATNDYTECRLNSPGNNPDSLDIENPQNAPGAHFGYAVNPMGNPFKFRITATRNTIDGGNSGDKIFFTYYTDETVTKTGTGAFSSIK